MDTARWKKMEALFMAALERNPDERAAFLDEACDEDQQLRQELEEMLTANEQSMALALEDRLLSHKETSNYTNIIGSHIGPYRIEKLIGEGGMGEVYLAQRDDDQYEQKVALKLVRPGYRNSQIMARFRVERQVLARLTHPNITQLLDGGIDDAGRPYLVMQYVEGIPITTYCDKHSLSIDERLVLFRVVCAAVQHAHRNLVVHRDLKPSNILVTAEGEVKLLDFGIAKLLNPDWEMSIAVTQSQVRMMTPEYAAPEQVKGEAITTATDVYALGILLYEILSGRRPYQLKNRIQAEVERIICEVFPSKPSTAVTEIGNESTSVTSPEKVSQARQTGISRLRKTLQGDLDNIVLMALRKEPTRRYSSASQLSDDIDRYSKGLPVHAQKDSVSYRTQKFVRRHLVTVFFSLLFVIVLLGFSISTGYQSRLLEVERDTAQIEKNRADQVISLLVGLFETANPAVVPGGDTLSVGEFVNKGAEKILEDVKDDEALSIELKHTLGRMYAAQGQYQEARQLLLESYEMQEARYGKNDSTTTAYMHDLALQLWRLGEAETARPMFYELLERNKRIFGPSHPRVASSMQGVSLVTEDDEEKRVLLESALAMRRALLPANHIDIAEGLNQLAIYHIGQNEWDVAAQMFRESLEVLEEILDPNHPSVVAVMNNLSTCLNKAGETDEAITILREAISRLKTVARDSSVQMANTVNNMAVLLTNQGNLEEAEAAFRHALGVQRVLLGETHPRVTNTTRNLALILGKLERYDEALPFMAQALNLKAGIPGIEEHKSMGVLRLQYAILLYNVGKFDEALHEGKQGIKILEATATANDPQLSEGQLWWGMILMAKGDLHNAEQYVQQSLASQESFYPAGDGRIAQVQCFYGRLLKELGRPKEAREMLEKGLPVYKDWPRANPNWVKAARQALEELG